MARSEETVEIVVQAKDDATRVLNDVQRGMTDLAKPTKGLTSALGGMGSALTTAVGTFAGGAALDLAARGFEELTGFVTGGISGAKEAAAGYAQLEAVLASTGGQVGLTAEELAGLSSDLSQAEGASTFADDQVLALENLLLTFTNVRGDIFKEATQIGVDMATAMGTDPKSAAIQLGKALNDPIKGISALSRVGVTFTDQQKDQIKAMQAAGDMAGAQAVILAELNKEFGGSAKAAAAAAGPMAQFQEQLGEFSEEIGAALLPLIQQFFGFLMSPQVQGAITTIVGLISGAITSISGFITDLQGDFADGGFQGLFNRLVTMIGEVGPQIQAQLATWGQAFLDWIAPLIGPFLEQLGALITAAANWIVEQYPILVEKAATWAAAFLDWIGPMIPPFLVKLGELVVAILGWVAEQVPTIAAKLGEWAIALTQWIGPRIPIIIEEIGKLLTALLNWMRDNAKDIDKTLEDWARSFGKWVMEKGWPALQTEMIKLGESMDTWMADQATTILNNALAWGKGIVDGLLKGVKDNWNRFTTWITNQLKKIPGFDLLFGSGASSGTGGGAGPFAAPMGLAAAGAGVVSGVTVPSVQMVPRRRVEDVPHRGVIVAPPVVINVDARGARDPVEVERAGYRGARRALEEAARQRVGRRSVQRLRTALDRRARIR